MSGAPGLARSLARFWFVALAWNGWVNFQNLQASLLGGNQSIAEWLDFLQRLSMVLEVLPQTFYLARMIPGNIGRQRGRARNQ